MPQALSIEEIRTKYPDEWVIVVDPVLGRGSTVRRGKVVAHSKNRSTVDRALLRRKPKRWASLYTGELPEDAAVAL